MEGANGERTELLLARLAELIVKGTEARQQDRKEIEEKITALSKTVDAQSYAEKLATVYIEELREKMKMLTEGEGSILFRVRAFDDAQERQESYNTHRSTRQTALLVTVITSITTISIEVLHAFLQWAGSFFTHKP